MLQHDALGRRYGRKQQPSLVLVQVRHQVDGVVGIKLGQRRGDVAGAQDLEYVLAHRVVEIGQNLGIEAATGCLDHRPPAHGIEAGEKIGDVGRMQRPDQAADLVRPLGIDRA